MVPQFVPCDGSGGSSWSWLAVRSAGREGRARTVLRRASTREMIRGRGARVRNGAWSFRHSRYVVRSDWCSDDKRRSHGFPTRFKLCDRASLADGLTNLPMKYPSLETNGHDPRPVVGLVGLGLMGTAFAATLLSRGFAVVGCDILAERRRQLGEMGVGCVEYPREVCARAEVVVLALMDSDVVDQVVSGAEGLLSGPARPSLIIDTSTGEPESTAALAAKLADRGIDYVDATVSGNSTEVALRRAVFMVGGERPMSAAA